MNIKIYTRSINYELFRKSQHTIGLPFPRVRLVNTTGDSYFYRIMKDLECDIAINIDEDAFVVNDNAIIDMMDYMLQENYVNCGMPDDQLIRNGNPIVTNPFFNILNLKEIRKLFNINEIKQFDYGKHKKTLVDKLPSHLSIDHNGLEHFGIESYYSFFFWLSLHFKTLYLDAETVLDDTSTLLKNHLDQPIILHSWYSREYNKDALQTIRIENVYKTVCLQKGINCQSPVIWKVITPIDRRMQLFKKKMNKAMKMLHT